MLKHNKVVSTQVRRRLLTRSKQLKCKVKTNQESDDANLNSSQDQSSCFDTSVEESDFLTPDSANESEMDQSVSEDTMIKVIASNMQEATIQDIQRSMQNHIKRLEEANKTSHNSDGNQTEHSTQAAVPSSNRCNDALKL